MGLTSNFVDIVLVIVLITIAISIIVERICSAVEHKVDIKALSDMYVASIEKGKLMNIDEFISNMVRKKNK